MRRSSAARSVPIRLPPRRLAFLVLTVVIAGYGALAIVGVVFQTRSLGQGLLSALFVLALLVLQLGYLSRPDRRPRPPWSLVALAVQAGLVFLPIILFGPVWHGFPGLLAGSALIVLPMMAGIPVFLLVVAAIAVVSAAGSPLTELLGSIVSVTYTVTSAVVSGIAVYGLSTLVRLVVEAHDAREELSRVAVSRERVRLARDVHDLLGQSLSSIALRGELVARLIGRHDDRVRSELADMLALSRQALADVRTVTGMRKDLEEIADTATPTPTPTPVGRLAPRLSRVMIGIVLVGLSVVAVVGVTQDRGLVAGVVVALSRTAIIVIILSVVGPNGHASRRTRYGLVVALALLTYLPMPFFGPGTHGAEAFLAGAVLILLRPAVAVSLTAVIWVGTVLTEYVDPAPTPSLAYSLTYTAVGFVVVTAIVYGLGTAARLVVEINQTRSELSRVAVARERVRFARDVHDLLGLGLSAITLKCELTGKLLDRSPERARHEFASMMTTVHQSLADVRSVIGGDRELSLEEEWAAVEATLAAAAVEVRLTREGGSPDGPPGTVLATVLREGATNILRHSAAHWCEISLSRSSGMVTLEIINDGVGSAAAVGTGQDPRGGNGLRNMTDRVESLGGELSTAVDGPVYRLRARVPAGSRGSPAVARRRPPP